MCAAARAAVQAARSRRRLARAAARAALFTPAPALCIDGPATPSRPAALVWRRTPPAAWRFEHVATADVRAWWLGIPPQRRAPMSPITLWRNARLATLDGDTPWGWIDAARCWSRASASLGRRRGRPARTACAVDARARPGRRAGHAGPGRLPHPPGLRRPARARVRAAAARRELRGHRARRRRHPLHRGRHARGQRRRSCSTRRAAARPRADGRGRDDARDQVGLRPSLPSTRRAACAWRAGSAANCRSTCAPPAWRRTRCRPSSTAAPTTTSTRVCDWLPALHARRPGRCGRRLLRAHRLHAGADAARVRGGARARAAGQAARRAAQRPGRRGAGRRVRRAVVRPPRAPVRRRRAGDGGAPARWRCCCPARYYFLRETKLPPVAGAARGRRADRAGHRPQPRLVARRCRCC